MNLKDKLEIIRQEHGIKGVANALASPLARIAQSFGSGGLLKNQDFYKRMDYKKAGLMGVQYLTEFLSKFEFPVAPRLEYRGLKQAKMADDETVKEGMAVFGIKTLSASGIQREFEIPLVIRDGEFLEPSVLTIDGAPRIICQAEIDSYLDKATFEDIFDVRGGMYTTPLDPELRDSLLEMREEIGMVPHANLGMYYMGSKKAQQYYTGNEEYVIVERVDGFVFDYYMGNVPPEEKGRALEDIAHDVGVAESVSGREVKTYDSSVSASDKFMSADPRVNVTSRFWSSTGLGRWVGRMRGSKNAQSYPVGVTDEQADQIVNLWQGGNAASDISDMMDLPYDLIDAVIDTYQRLMMAAQKKAMNIDGVMTAINSRGFVWDMGQLDDDTLKELKAKVRSGELKKGRGRWPYYSYGTIDKAIYYKPDMTELDLENAAKVGKKISKKKAQVVLMQGDRIEMEDGIIVTIYEIKSDEVLAIDDDGKEYNLSEPKDVTMNLQSGIWKTAQPEVEYTGYGDSGEVVSLMEQGYGIEEIAAITGKGTGEIYQILEQYAEQRPGGSGGYDAPRDVIKTRIGQAFAICPMCGREMPYRGACKCGYTRLARKANGLYVDEPEPIVPSLPSADFLHGLMEKINPNCEAPKEPLPPGVDPYTDEEWESGMEHGGMVGKIAQDLFEEGVETDDPFELGEDDLSTEQGNKALDLILGGDMTAAEIAKEVGVGKDVIQMFWVNINKSFPEMVPEIPAAEYPGGRRPPEAPEAAPPPEPAEVTKYEPKEPEILLQLPTDIAELGIAPESLTQDLPEGVEPGWGTGEEARRLQPGDTRVYTDPETGAEIIQELRSRPGEGGNTQFYFSDQYPIETKAPEEDEFWGGMPEPEAPPEAVEPPEPFEMPAEWRDVDVGEGITEVPEAMLPEPVKLEMLGLPPTEFIPTEGAMPASMIEDIPEADVTMTDPETGQVINVLPEETMDFPTAPTYYPPPEPESVMTVKEFGEIPDPVPSIVDIPEYITEALGEAAPLDSELIEREMGISPETTGLGKVETPLEAVPPVAPVVEPPVVAPEPELVITVQEPTVKELGEIPTPPSPAVRPAPSPPTPEVTPVPVEPEAPPVAPRRAPRRPAPPQVAPEAPVVQEAPVTPPAAPTVPLITPTITPGVGITPGTIDPFFPPSISEIIGPPPPQIPEIGASATPLPPPPPAGAGEALRTVTSPPWTEGQGMGAPVEPLPQVDPDDPQITPQGLKQSRKKSQSVVLLSEVEKLASSGANIADIVFHLMQRQATRVEIDVILNQAEEIGIL